MGEKGQEIYYTLDGSLPVKGSETTYLYEQGILLECESRESVVTVKSIAYDENGESTRLCSGTYFMGSKIGDRFDMPVLVVSGNPEELLDSETGIFAMGEYSEWESWNRYQTGREAERQVTVSLFDSDGSVLLEQSCGIRIAGKASRKKNQPSFRLFARKEYDNQNEFSCLFFEDQYGQDGTLIDEFESITVRNSGNDNGYAFIRSELASRLCREAGFADVQCASPVCVYINGEYFGPYWFVTNYDDAYFENTYGKYDGEIYVYEGEMYHLNTEGEDEKYDRLARAYNRRMRKLKDADFTDEDSLAELNELIDVENFLQYMALQNYLGNMDTLNNNFKVYRYYTEGEYTPGTVFDGRFRFLIYDMDATLGLKETAGGWNINPGDAPLATRKENFLYTELFDNLMQVREYREYYIRYTFSLVNHFFSEREVMPIVEEMHALRASELQYMCDNTRLLEGNWIMDNDGTFENVLQCMGQISSFVTARPGIVAAELAGTFGQTMDTVVVTNESQAAITMDFATFHDTEFVGNYLAETPLELSVTPRQGYRFEYWLINGKQVREESLLVEASDVIDGLLEIQCICSPDFEVGLLITGVKSNGNRDFIELTNFGAEEENLKDYRLTDDKEVWDKSTLPGIAVKSGETIRIYGKSYTGAEALGCPGVNFNIKEGETVSLYRKDGVLCNEVELPKLGTPEGVYRIDVYTGTFREELP